MGMCAVCHKALCRRCVHADSPRLICQTCTRGVVFGYEYRSPMTIGAWPLLHVSMGVDPITMRPKVAKGVIAIGNIAIGGFALGGIALGLLGIGGISVGVLVALGGLALGVGFSLGGVAVGTVAVGGLAVGLKLAIGGSAFAPSVLDNVRCDEAAREWARSWLGRAPRC